MDCIIYSICKCTVQDHVSEWANMTGFLCALGSVALLNRQMRSSAPPADRNSTESRKSSVFQQETEKSSLALVSRTC